MGVSCAKKRPANTGFAVAKLTDLKDVILPKETVAEYIMNIAEFLTNSKMQAITKKIRDLSLKYLETYPRLQAPAAAACPHPVSHIDLTPTLLDDFGQAARYFADLSQKMSNLSDHIYSFVSTSKRTLNRLEEKLIEGNLFSLFPSNK